MGIYYYKLWGMLESRNITQRELIENLHLSTGLVTGSKEADGTYLAPQGLAAREQAAAILMRYVKANA